MAERRRRRARRALDLAAAALIAGTAACGASDAVDNTGEFEIVMAPPAPSVRVGETVQLSATVQRSGGNVVEGNTIFWSSERPEIASVDQEGLVSGLSIGVTRIAASVGGRSGVVDVTVERRRVGRIVINSNKAEMIVGDTASLSVHVEAANGEPLSGVDVAITSSAPSVAEVTSGPRAVGKSPGTAELVATADGVSGSTALKVNPAPVASITLAPENPRIGINGTVVIRATLHDARGNVLTGRTVTFSSSNTTVATVASDGTVRGLRIGNADITASSEGRSATTRVTVSPTATSLTVDPSTLSLLVGRQEQLTTTLVDENGVVINGMPVTWSSSATQVATVSGTGVVSAVAPGAAVITASSGGTESTAGVTVSAVPVGSVVTSPASVSVAAGATRQLVATVTTTDGQVVTDRVVSWTSSAPLIASVSSSGLVTAHLPGSATVTASSEGKSGSTAVTVTPAPIVRVVVSPSSAALLVGETRTLTATAFNVLDQVVSGTATWSTSAPAVATVSSSGPSTGVVRAEGPGSATIRATIGGVEGIAAVTVSSPPPNNAVAIQIVSGDEQVGSRNGLLPQPVVVRAVDAQNRAVPGVLIVFEPQHGGTANPTQSTTNTDGLAFTQWRLGNKPGEQLMQVISTGLKTVLVSAVAQ